MQEPRILGLLAAKCGGDRPAMRLVGGLTIVLLAACSDVRTVQLGEVAEARGPSRNTADMPSAPGELNDAGTPMPQTNQAQPDAGATSTSSGAAGASTALPPTAADAAAPSTNTRDAQLDDDEDDDSEESGQSERGRDQEEDAGERSED